MVKLRIASDDTFLILAPRGADLGLAWQIGLLALLLLVPLTLIVWLYRYELHLVPRWHAAGLLLLRLTVLLVLWLAIGLQPHLVEVQVLESPSRVRVAVDLSSSMGVADPQRKSQERADLARALKLPGIADTLTRKEVVQRLLAVDGVNLLNRLGERHEVEIVGFHQRGADMTAAALLGEITGRINPDDTRPTDLGLALTENSGPNRPGLLGIILLSDGRHNVGAAPFERAESLGRQRTPIFPVVIGARDAPSDLMILDVDAKAEAAKDMIVPIEIRVKATQLPPQDLTVEMQFEGKAVLPEHRQVIPHKGKDEVYAVRFQARMDKLGTHTYQIRATSKGQEITRANNDATRFIRVADDKTKVLLVDGESRWEYHYLATALMRDPKVHLERVVFTQPRIGAIKDAEVPKLGFAKTKLPEFKTGAKDVDPLLDFDCIFLGDVAPEQLPLADRRRLEKYVAQRGGTLVLSAGKRHLPMDYLKLTDDPLAKLLPIEAPRLLDEDKGFILRVTSEGQLPKFLRLEPELPAAPWPELPKHFWGVEGKRKPGASVLLAAVPGDKPSPAGQGVLSEDRGILVQQSYGLGRVLYVGIDSTWRWRFRMGDTYHHRFWGQIVQWSASDKLLPAGNQFVRYGSRAPVYMEDEAVELAARLGGSLPPLVDPSVAKARLYRQLEGKPEELVREVSLTPKESQPNLLEAKASPLAPGLYRMELDIAPYRAQITAPGEDADAPQKGRDLFRVLPRENTEMLDLSVNATLLESLAQRSNGKVYTPEMIDELLGNLARRIERSEKRDEAKPWQHEPMVWWMMGLLLGLLCAEWCWRKWLDLP